MPILLYFCRMEDQQTMNRTIAIAWREAWANRKFRIKTIIGSIVFLGILISFPYFFGLIEQREGIVLNDPILTLVPAVDVSALTFIFIWSMIAYFLFRCIQNPSFFMLGFCCMILLFLSRMITISLFPLNPPDGLIPLIDPVSNLFYGGPRVFMTKDLFYSGHTSTQFMIFLCFSKRRDKGLALLSSVVVGILVLVQHVHYSIDVVGAFLLTYFVYLLGRRIADY
ncbi:MAG: hypothetical protein JWQ30_1424 [Sediminibacterium sp.]|nr:hypothetical protein [Sediminibacterium sp.]